MLARLPNPLYFIKVTVPSKTCTPTMLRTRRGGAVRCVPSSHNRTTPPPVDQADRKDILSPGEELLRRMRKPTADLIEFYLSRKTKPEGFRLAFDPS
jgi:hypothetical protein